MFQGRNLVIATKHQKEKVIAPLMEVSLGVKCVVVHSFDTDELGTFTGEVERKDDPITTARKKCLRAMELSGCDLAIASEGSFGPHPLLFFVPADDELLIFIDKKNDLEILERELTTETNFNGQEIKTESELSDFAREAKFPTHGLIIRKAKDDFTEITKGITNWEQLRINFRRLLEKFGVVYVETDMRAMYNPSRMDAIEKATQKLIEKINSCCPECKTPGFGITTVRQGLPCGECGFPTRSTLSHIYLCKKCSFTIEKMFPYEKCSEDPAQCDRCNP